MHRFIQNMDLNDMIGMGYCRDLFVYIYREISKLKGVSQDDVLAVSTRSLCPTCQGSGLNPKVLECKIYGLNIAEYDQLELTELLEELKKIKVPMGEDIAKQIIPQVKQLIDMGL